MRTLIVGDVHGCSRELHRLLRKARPSRVVLVGDMFTRGPDPRGVWELIRKHRIEAVLGNHDVDVLERWTPGKELPKRAFRWLCKLPLGLKGPGFIAVHAAIHPSGLARTSRDVATGIVAAPRRWDQRWRGELVIHGHTSRHGLHDRRPYALGLDTACVRGGRLTGYLIEKDALVSVRAKRAYA